VFYINLPIGGVSLILLWLFLRVKWDKETKVWDKLKRIDVIGNSILMASTIAVLIALTWAGVEHSWSSYQVLVPLIVGLAGLIGFFYIEGCAWVTEPVMFVVYDPFSPLASCVFDLEHFDKTMLTLYVGRPLHLFANHTSTIIYVNTFIISMLNYWIFFFLPLYFQAVQLSTPTQSGIQILPITLIGIPGAAVGGVALAKWGKYKLLHMIGFALLAAGIASFSVLNKSSTTAMWVGLQVLPAVGAGMILDTLLPAFQAGVEEVDSAAAAASWSFIRSFGNIWGVAVPGAILNIYSSRYAADIIAHPTARSALQNGDAYSSGTRDFILTFPELARDQIIEVFTRALSMVFIIGMAFPVLSFLLSFVERDVKLRTELETDFGLEDREEKKPDEMI
jgi:hypothetical protein